MSQQLQALKILGLKPGASKEQIKHAYRSLAQKLHPDKNPDPRAQRIFIEVKKAYETLVKPPRRATKVSSNRQSGVNEKRSGPSQARRARPTGETTWVSQLGGPGKILLKLAEKLVNSATFTLEISAIESVVGTSRTVELQTENRTQTVKVNIPAGIVSGTILQAKVPKAPSIPSKVIRTQVIIRTDRLLDREGRDVVVRLPITVKEAILGAVLDVPTAQGPVKIKLPPKWNCLQRLRLKGCGIKDPASGLLGEFFVQVYIVLPPVDDKNITTAAMAIEHFYEKNVRIEVPKRISQPRGER